MNYIDMIKLATIAYNAFFYTLNYY